MYDGVDVGIRLKVRLLEPDLFEQSVQMMR